MNRCPNAAQILANTQINSLYPLQIMLGFIINSPVLDCLISFFAIVSSKMDYPQNEAIYLKVAQSGFMDRLAQIINTSSKRGLI